MIYYQKRIETTDEYRYAIIFRYSLAFVQLRRIYEGYCQSYISNNRLFVTMLSVGRTVNVQNFRTLLECLWKSLVSHPLQDVGNTVGRHAGRRVRQD